VATGTPLKLGAPAPDFSLRDVAGRPVSLEYYRGQRHIVLVFYIGHT
jgi:peroxiredoxin